MAQYSKGTYVYAGKEPEELEPGEYTITNYRIFADIYPKSPFPIVHFCYEDDTHWRMGEAPLDDVEFNDDHSFTI